MTEVAVAIAVVNLWWLSLVGGIVQSILRSRSAILHEE